MKVNYDFSNLGRTLVVGGGMNGITRVIVEIAIAMYKEASISKGIDLDFSSDYYPQARRVIEGYFDGKDVPLKLHEDTKLNEFFYKIFVQFELPFHKGRRLGEFFEYQNSIRNCDIYFSTFFPVSENNRRKKSRLVFNTVHDVISETSPQYFTRSHVRSMRDLYNKIVRESDYFFSVSDYTKRQFCEHYNVHESRVFTTPLAISTSFFCKDTTNYDAVRTKYGIEIGQKYILCLATIEPRKNINTLLESYISLEPELARNGIKLVVCGGLGWGYQSTLELIENSRVLKENTIFTGFVPDEDVVAIYSGALCFCYIPFEEGFGLPPLEAMACGTAVVSSNTSSLPEVVGDSAVMVAPYSVDDISSGILSIVKNDPFREMLENSGRERAREFEWSRTVKAILRIFKEKS